jgi:hypothetical protein
MEEENKVHKKPSKSLEAPHTPTKSISKIQVKNPSYSAPPKQKFSITQKNSQIREIEWISKRDFQIIDENTKLTHSPITQHLSLREMVDKANMDENSFALQLAVLIESNESSPMLISYPLKHENNDLLFVSGAAITDQIWKENLYIYSGAHFLKSENDKSEFNNWFKSIYGIEDIEQKRKEYGRTYFHTEQWGMMYLFKNAERILDNFIKEYKPVKVHGIFLDGHTKIDSCEQCQNMFRTKIEPLEIEIKKLSNFEKIISREFFLLPILSSQIYYSGSKRLNPLDTLKSNNFKNNNGKLSQELNDKIQYTVQYKEKYTEKFKIVHNLKEDFLKINKFPAFWLYKAQECTKDINEELFKLFQCTEWKEGKMNFLYEKFNKSIDYLSFKHLNLAIGLTSLNLTSANLGEDGADELAVVLPRLSSLTNLNLADNNFGKKISEISKPTLFCSMLTSLTHIKGLKILDLSKNAFENETIKVLVNAIENLKNLQELILQDAQINYESADLILTQAQSMLSLVKINLSDKECLSLKDQESIQHNTKLCEKVLSILSKGRKFALYTNIYRFGTDQL